MSDKEAYWVIMILLTSIFSFFRDHSFEEVVGRFITTFIFSLIFYLIFY